ARCNRAITGRIPGSHYPARAGRNVVQRNCGHRRCSHRNHHVASGACSSPAPTALDENLYREQMSTEHERIRELLHAYVDGELDLANARETERHLRSCADCRGTEKAIRELRSALTSEATAYRARAHLRRPATRSKIAPANSLAVAHVCDGSSVRRNSPRIRVFPNDAGSTNQRNR